MIIDIHITDSYEYMALLREGMLCAQISEVKDGRELVVKKI